VAKVLVEVDLKEGLAKSLKIIVEEIIHEQVLDYFKIPFRCSRCHAYGHVLKDHMHPFVRKLW
jgi:hypothetical protein